MAKLNVYQDYTEDKYDDKCYTIKGKKTKSRKRKLKKFKEEKAK